MTEGGRYRVHGRLRLRFEAEQPFGRTVLAVRDQRPPLQVVRAFETGEGGALVHLHNLSGGVLGGDRLELMVEVGAAARAQLTSTGATRVYRSRPEVADACQSIAVRIEENGVLEYLPDPLIPYAGARYRQEVRIDLASGAGLFWWETVTPGRLMRGEIFAYERLRMDMDLQAAGLLIARERFRLEPGVRPLSSSARLGSYRTFATQSPRGGCHAASAAVEEPRSSFHPDLTFAGRGAILECAHPANDHDPASRRRGPSADA